MPTFHELLAKKAMVLPDRFRIEAFSGQLHAEGKPVAAIARMVALTRKTM